MALTPGTRLERIGRIVNYLWMLAAVVVFVLWLQDPGLFTQESTKIPGGHHTSPNARRDD